MGMSYERKRKPHLMLDGIEHRYCRRCDNYFPIDIHFYRINSGEGSLGFSYRCKLYEKDRRVMLGSRPRVRKVDAFIKGEIIHGLHNSENPHGEVEEAIKVLEGMGFEYGGDYPVYYQFLDRLKQKYGIDIIE